METNEREFVFEENEEALKRKRYYEYAVSMEERKRKEKPLIFALIGLICSLFYGVGGVFSVIAAVKAFGYKGEKVSSLIIWARALSIIGILLNLTFFVYFVAFSSLLPTPSDLAYLIS